ncbi:MAG: GerMN domain-containing protein [Spirochaetota bacterium]
MTNDSKLRIHLPGILLVLSLLIAVLFYLVFPPDRVARTLFFPGTTDATLSGERRLLPRAESEQRAMHLLTEEILLGPARIGHGRALPRESRVRSFILSGQTVFVDLNEEAMLPNSEVHVDTETGIDAIRETLLFNFRSLDEVIITIDGDVPFAPSYRPVGP